MLDTGTSPQEHYTQQGMHTIDVIHSVYQVQKILNNIEYA